MQRIRPRVRSRRGPPDVLPAHGRSALAGAPGGPTGPGRGAPRLKIGITGLIWGATPRTPENLEQALADMSSLGYHCFETWGSVMQALDAKGTLAELLQPASRFRSARRSWASTSTIRRS